MKFSFYFDRHIDQHLFRHFLQHSIQVAILIGFLPSPMANAAILYTDPTGNKTAARSASAELRAHTSKVISKEWLKFSYQETNTGWMRSSLAALEWDFASRAFVTDPVEARPAPNWSAAPERLLDRGTKIFVTSRDENWIKGIYKGKTYFIDRAKLAISPESWGYAIIKQKAPYYLKGSSRPVGHFQPGIKVAILNIENEKIVFEWNGKRHMTEIYNTVTRFDFAQKVKIGSKWKDVRFLIGAWIQTKDGSSSHLTNVEELIGDSNRAYILTSKANVRESYMPLAKKKDTLIQFTPVKVIETKLLKWGQTRAQNKKGWWIYEDHIQPQTKPLQKQTREKVAPRLQTANKELFKPSQTQSLSQIVGEDLKNLSTLSTDELFAREIFDVSISPKKSNLMLASAKGIYITVDGEVWAPIKYFGQKNYPIAIAETGTVFVGPYRSDNEGKTFHQFIRWDLVLEALQKRNITSTQQLRMKDIAIKDKFGREIEILLEIDGSKETSIMSFDSGYSWRSEG